MENIQKMEKFEQLTNVSANSCSRGPAEENVYYSGYYLSKELLPTLLSDVNPHLLVQLIGDCIVLSFCSRFWKSSQSGINLLGGSQII